MEKRRQNKSRLKWNSFLLLFVSADLFAAACCGSGSYLPSIISGDDTAQFSSTVSLGQVFAEVDSQGVSVPTEETSFSTNFEAATLIADRWQVGVGIPIRVRSRSTSDTTANLGDLSASVSFEAFPQYEYSAWKPRGYVFLQAKAPTGTSRFEATGFEATGKGFWSVSSGLLLIKTFGNVDVSLVGFLGRSLPRTFSNGRYAPGWHFGTITGAGYSPGGGAFRVGLSLSTQYEQSIAVSESLTAQPTPAEMVWQPAIQVSYMPSSTISLVLSYSDQSLLPLSRNTSLSRSVSLLFQKRWER